MNDDQYREALTILLEECSEVIQECSKILRFGGDCVRLNKEIADMLVLIEYLTMNDVIDLYQVEVAMEQKREKLRVWSSLYE